jgi:hypothetical protein
MVNGPHFKAYVRMALKQVLKSEGVRADESVKRKRRDFGKQTVYAKVFVAEEWHWLL